jgi:hypothetical protein
MTLPVMRRILGPTLWWRWRAWKMRRGFATLNRTLRKIRMQAKARNR